MTAPRPIVVRRRHIAQKPRPVGEFAALADARGMVPRFASRALGTFCFNTHDRVVGLTYDDGPNPEQTPAILDVLAERGATATFFVMTPRAAAHPEIVRRIVAEGHELALHGNDHRFLPRLPVREVYTAIRDGRRRLEALSGARVRRFRPPYGEITPPQALAVWSLGLEYVIWTSDAVDWIHRDEAAIAERAVEGVFPGGIALMHDDRADPETLQPGEELPHFDRAEVLSRFLDATDRQGYQVRSIADLSQLYQPVRSFSRDIAWQ